MNILIALALFVAPILMGLCILIGILVSRIKLPPAYAVVRRAIRSRIASVGPDASAA